MTVWFDMIRAAADWEFTHPNPGLSPEEVVRLQVAALRDDCHTEDHRGLAACFEFASPENQAQTGPLDRFKRMVQSPAYCPLLRSDATAFGPMRKTTSLAFQMVAVRYRAGADSEGLIASYLWRLSLQRRSFFAGCWMTDAVIPMPIEELPEEWRPVFAE